MIESGMVGINIETERNWTWVSGNTYPVKEELKQQGFLWSAKRRAWYNRSIVEVKLNGNEHKVKPTQQRENTFVKEKTTAKNTTVMVKVRATAKRKTVIPKKEFFLIDLVSKIVEYSEDVCLQVEPIGLLKTLNLVERTKRISYNAEGKIIKQEIISEKDADIQKISELVSKYNELHETENKAYREWMDYSTGQGEENEESLKLKQKWLVVQPIKRMEELYNE